MRETVKGSHEEAIVAPTCFRQLGLDLLPERFAIARLQNGQTKVEMIVVDAAGNERRELLRWSDDRSALTPAHSGD